MPSLKDLRNRIASVKATQKITKAMQMVAAAKLRRAQEAAEAARPYSQRMGAVLANIAQAVGGGGDAPALMAGTGKDDVHLLVVCTAERGLCGGFNSPDRAPRARPHPQAAGGRQDGQDHLRRQEGLRHPAPRLRRADHRARRPARSQAARLRQRRRDRPQGHRAVRRGRVRRLHAVLFRVQVGDHADPDRAAAHPGRGSGRGTRADTGGDRGLRIRAGAGRDPRRPPAAQHLGADLPGAARERRPARWARR